ncbi:MAG: heme oxygenase (biliverdin-producing) [Phormidesmis sp.]
MCAPSSMCPPLAICLKAGTKEAHVLAEQTAFMKCAMKGIVTTATLRQLLANLYFVYDALEHEIRNHAKHPVVSVIHFPRLERSQPLEKDLAFYYGDDWRNQIVPSRKTIRYVMRIHAIANISPALLAAHAYVRYMGDLSGGQRLKTIIRSVLVLPEPALSDGGGTAFYDFKGLPTAEARQTFKARYRDALNMLPVDAELAVELIKEANIAFKLNRDVLKELDPPLKATVGEARWQSITEARVDAPKRQHSERPHSAELVGTR